MTKEQKEIVITKGVAIGFTVLGMRPIIEVARPSYSDQVNEAYEVVKDACEGMGICEFDMKDALQHVLVSQPIDVEKVSSQMAAILKDPP